MMIYMHEVRAGDWITEFEDYATGVTFTMPDIIEIHMDSGRRHTGKTLDFIDVKRAFTPPTTKTGGNGGFSR